MVKGGSNISHLCGRCDSSLGTENNRKYSLLVSYVGIRGLLISTCEDFIITQNHVSVAHGLASLVMLQ